MSSAAVAALLLADGRLPSGGHAHSGGLEAAAASGAVADVDSLAAFLRGRLETAGRVAAGLAAAACHGGHAWADLDAEADARTASPAQRAASRRQGRQLARAAARMGWAAAGLAPADPHHAVAMGAVAAAAGLAPLDAARWAALSSVAGPATAAVRLLGLDPFAVHGLLAGLAPAVEAVAAEAGGTADGPLAGLACGTAPLLDIGAEDHLTWEVRLFAS